MRNPQTVKFGEWLPDIPAFENPGLTEALNCLPVDQQYAPYYTFAASSSAIANRPQGGFAALDPTGNSYIYAGDATKLYVLSGGSFVASSASYTIPGTEVWSFAQYDDQVIATDYSDVPQVASIGSSAFGALASVGTAPNARYVGIIGQFVVLGNTNDVNGVLPHRLQWSSVNQPQNWPTPGSLAAIAAQAGAQVLRAEFGGVTGIVGGDQIGIVLQKNALVRMQYVGGNVVFNFDTYEEKRGGFFPNATIKVGNLVYFIAADGFYVTDGSSSTPIGKARVDRTFLGDCDQTYIERVRAGVDYFNKCIYWCYPSHGASNGVPDSLIVYNYVENRWTHANDTVQLIFLGLTVGYTLDGLAVPYPVLDNIPLPLDSPVWQGGQPALSAFGPTNALGTFAGAAATATLTSGEFELNPMARSTIQGIRPLVTGNPTSISVAISSRNTQNNSTQSFGLPITPTAGTGVCDLMQDTKFIAMQAQIQGGFTKAIGASFIAEPTGNF